MRWESEVVGLVAFLESVGLLIVAIILQSATNQPTVLLLVIGSALWAAWDSSQIHLREYKSGWSNGPVGIALGILLIWIVAFPIYLATRHGVTHGKLRRIGESAPAATPYAGQAPASAAQGPSTSGELERLADLRQRGILTEEEFSAAKAKALRPPQN